MSQCVSSFFSPFSLSSDQVPSPHPFLLKSTWAFSGPPLGCSRFLSFSLSLRTRISRPCLPSLPPCRCLNHSIFPIHLSVCLSVWPIFSGELFLCLLLYTHTKKIQFPPSGKIVLSSLQTSGLKPIFFLLLILIVSPLPPRQGPQFRLPPTQSP